VTAIEIRPVDRGGLGLGLGAVETGAGDGCALAKVDGASADVAGLAVALGGVAEGAGAPHAATTSAAP